MASAHPEISPSRSLGVEGAASPRATPTPTPVSTLALASPPRLAGKNGQSNSAEIRSTPTPDQKTRGRWTRAAARRGYPGLLLTLRHCLRVPVSGYHNPQNLSPQQSRHPLSALSRPSEAASSFLGFPIQMLIGFAPQFNSNCYQNRAYLPYLLVEALAIT